MSTTRWLDALPRAALAPFAAVLLLAACSRPTNQTPTQDTRQVGDFTSIELRGGARLDVLVGPAPSLVVAGGTDEVAAFVGRVENGTLVLERERRVLGGWGGGDALHLRVTVPALGSLVVNGATAATLTGLSGGELRLELNGASSLEASGSVDRVDARLSGAGSMDLSRLVAAKASVEANGAGNIKVHATSVLDARVNGVGTVRYLGNPAEVHKSINGLGSIAAE